ncbi:META domain-containing protein [Flavobacterium aquicola]|uniref:META domain-containing protein n=1 Tax=Flavobacterium aquicola TaxID=1682742 RepID=A0A3E0EUB7_9FLAO|nr:META domain-containing protein [Flavobacterium aquicola]REH01719.1 META domain-containing protein [Flavobacterium aquicola]
MRKIKLLLLFVCISFISCSTQQKKLKTFSLDGTWELNYITGPKIAFGGLYPHKKPTIVFDVTNNKIAGNNSCNQYFGALLLDGAKINFKDAKMGMTMMACEGNGDSLYMETLQKIETYTITDDGRTLNFLLGDIIMMKFSRQK